MPVYVYRCEGCGSRFEKRQSFTDAPLTECDSCHGQLHKVLQPTVVIYKGSGFYSTDYHSKSGGNGRDGEGNKEESAKPASESTSESPKDAGKTATAAKSDK